MTNKDTKNRGLGRGLSALMADVQPTGQSVAEDTPKVDARLPIEVIHPNPDQPRKDFDENELQGLADSIQKNGIVQPLIVRPDPNASGEYQIVAGERRWRAAQLAKLHEVPVVIREFTDIEVLEIAIVENVQRSDLSPVEEARGYRQLIDAFGHTQEALSKSMGKSRSHIANTMRLLQLPDDVLYLLSAGELSAGHARALIGAENASALAKTVVSKALNVRQTEALVKGGDIPGASKKSTKAETKPAEKDADTRAIEGDLSAQLKMKVRIDHAAQGEGGKLVIQYGDLDQLDDLCRILSGY